MYIPQDNKHRCDWCLKDELYVQYHDLEWGTPVYDDTVLFEFLILESFQAGLSWHTILKKRENFRRAFASFDATTVAAYGEKEIDLLMQDKGIIRNRLKIEAAINNARCFLEIQRQYGTFSNYIWSFTDGKIIRNFPVNLLELPATSPHSDAMSKDMTKKGFKFRGSKICYAFMQAIGMVDDHLVGCWKKSYD
ncbi:MAG: DNA-3-methyladenine glycosylase I [Chitinophagales bacterium]|nr:DNA-3-methyladenine glycosylase I [Chitinophagales bacterium]MDW8274055.1 DNA-3-methyladenine glycosylase I [Chitinophagales bacterium]